MDRKTRISEPQYTKPQLQEPNMHPLLAAHIELWNITFVITQIPVGQNLMELRVLVNRHRKVCRFILEYEREAFLFG